MKLFGKIAAGLTVLLITSVGIFTLTAQAAVNDFVISDFQADYYLSRDSDNRSRLKTVEKITAEFPSYDQNHGIERAIPKSYDGHSTSLSVQSVTRGDGQEWNYSTYTSGDNLVLRIGDADAYVHGAQTYVITYTQRDVTKYFADRNVDEFYWDTNGTEWQVPIESARARVHIDPSLTAVLNGDAACYIGSAGSNEQCGVTNAQQNGTATFSTSSSRTLQAGENISLAIGFHPGTFAPYSPSLFERIVAIWAVVTGFLVAISVGIITWLVVRFMRVTNRKKELGTIVPEYLPPTDTSVTAASQVISYPRGVMTAQLLDLAVRHYIKIYETKEKTTFTPAQYEIEIVKDLSGLKWEEREIVSDMFAGSTAVGSRLNLKTLQSSFGFSTRTTNNDSDLAKLVRGEYGLREKTAGNAKWFRCAAMILLIFGVILLSIPLLITALIAFIMSFVVWSLTDKGLALNRYLEGLKLYIQVAETERIKMLQSPEGAAKAASVVNGTEPAQLVTLYERVLPYAVLFGQEKEWSKQLGAYYENIGSSPDWYNSHSGAFNAVVFASAMNSFSTSTTTYASSSSSSTSGSSGGGSSGSGGGGGGGGGW